MDKNKLINIVYSNSRDSFIYELHYKNKFKKGKYNRLKKAFEFFISNKKEMTRNEIVKIQKEFLITFHHILFLFICDESKEDLYKIKPYLEIEYKTSIYFEIRDMIDKIIE